MAGLGEMCLHVGALLYWIEYQVCRTVDVLRLVQHLSQIATWLEPHAIRHVLFLHLEDIDFTVTEQSTKDYKQLQCSSKSNHILRT